MARENPYNRLKRICFDWAVKARHPETIHMFTYPNVSQTNWNLKDLRERVCAAEQLGYDVVIRAKNEEELSVYYKKKTPNIPLELQ